MYVNNNDSNELINESHSLVSEAHYELDLEPAMNTLLNVYLCHETSESAL